MAINAATFTGALTYELIQRQRNEMYEDAFNKIKEDLDILSGIRLKLMSGTFNMVRTMLNNLRTDHPYKDMIYNEVCEILSILDEVQGEDN